MVDVTIIGVGVIGAITVRELIKYNLSACVLEHANDAATGASRANSGIAHAGFDEKLETTEARFNIERAEMMPRIAEELGFPYRQNGSLVLGYTDADQ